MSLQRLAYVDDDADICDIVRFALVDIGGFDVRCWQDGATFFREAGPAWMPQMVLLDINMPGMTGWEILAALRGAQQTSGVAVVMLSADSATDDATACDDVLGYIAKPFDPLRLAEDMQRMWARHCGGERT